uniref:Uncharacterized protein n=1 Tax=Oryza barthii TaxID=65489 RepID=A0A0D3G498_9ORYZ
MPGEAPESPMCPDDDRPTGLPKRVTRVASHAPASATRARQSPADMRCSTPPPVMHPNDDRPTGPPKRATCAASHAPASATHARQPPADTHYRGLPPATRHAVEPPPASTESNLGRARSTPRRRRSPPPPHLRGCAVVGEGAPPCSSLASWLSGVEFRWRRGEGREEKGAAALGNQSSSRCNH